MLRCPECGYELELDQDECPNCGAIIGDYEDGEEFE
ncbi:MAG TPA: zinc-ribbon domain-containing protein [Thermoplasmata archaeon]